VDSGDQAEERKSVVAPGQFFSPQQIEYTTVNLLREYTREYSWASDTPPVPVERIAEDLLDLRILWEPIPEKEGQVILAKLVARKQQVIFNESRQDLFDEIEFLYNTTIAHEIGHWILHIERGNWGRQQTLFEIEEPEYIVYRSSGSSRGSWDEKNAHRFMGCLSMPHQLLTKIATQTPVSNFSELYSLRNQFKVTVSALTIRLADLNIAYIDADGRFYPSREAFQGQANLW
jgi:hypothetical protein